METMKEFSNGLWCFFQHGWHWWVYTGSKRNYKQAYEMLVLHFSFEPNVLYFLSCRPYLVSSKLNYGYILARGVHRYPSTSSIVHLQTKLFRGNMVLISWLLICSVVRINGIVCFLCNIYIQPNNVANLSDVILNENFVWSEKYGNFCI